MFDEYFVTCNVAEALRKVGYDEPCMAIRERYKQENTWIEDLFINYSNKPPNPELYKEAYQKILQERPNILATRFTNSQLQPWCFAAPLYPQVAKWLRGKGLFLQDSRIPIMKTDMSMSELWMVSIYNQNGKQLWPAVPLVNYHQNIKKFHFESEREAWDKAIIAATQQIIINRQ